MFNHIQFIKSVLLVAALLSMIGKLCAQPLSQQVGKLQKVTGQVSDSRSGKKVQGISVSYADYAATLTDKNGAFTLNLPSTTGSLVLQGSGYQRAEIALKGRNKIQVKLIENGISSLYIEAEFPEGKRALNQTASSIVVADTKGGWDIENETPDNFTQGRIAGLNALRRSGTPGIGAQLWLRGLTSLNASNQPLIVVDGMIYDNTNYGSSLIGGHQNNPLQNIEIKDVEGITVIKDALTTYGTKAANGVILIRTSRAGQLATKIDFSLSGGVNIIPSNLPLLKASDYRLYLADLYKSAGLNSASFNALPFVNDDPAFSDYYEYHNDTDWQKQMFSASSNQNYYLKVTGGDNIASYALSVGYQKNEGIIKNTDLSRYNTRFNADMNLTKKLKATTNLAFTYNEQNLRDQGLSDKTSAQYLALIKSPLTTFTELDNQGKASPNLAGVDIFGIGNPVALIDNASQDNKNYRFSGSVGLSYEFSKSLNLNTLFGITYDKVRENSFIPSKGVAVDTLDNALANNRMGSRVQRFYSVYNDTRLSYEHIFSSLHQLKIFAGLRYNANSSEEDYALGYNSATDDLISVGTGVNALRRVGGDIGKWKWLNSYLGGQYIFSSKYILNGNLAVDGSSRFGDKVPDVLRIAGSNLAILPALGAAWVISSENFMANVTAVDLLKLRISYGITGNDDIGNYNARNYYSSQNLLGMQGLIRGNVANPELQWEQVAKLNAGIDAAFFNERISLSVDLFKNKSSKLITYETAPQASGFDFILTNSGSLTNTGAEISLTGRILNKGLIWDAGFNIGTYQTKVGTIPGDSYITSYAGGAYLTQTGKEANLFYGYRTKGVYSTDEEALAQGYSTSSPSGERIAFQGGDVRFTDQNADQVIDSSDRLVIGNPNPDFYGGFSNSLLWKSWSLDALLTFSIGNDIYNYTRSVIESQSSSSNQSNYVINRWRVPGQQTEVPRAVEGDPTGNARFSDRWIEDGSYLRLRTLSLGYKIPTEGRFFKNAKVIVTANNLVTLTKYLGYDPEFSSSGSIYTSGVDTGLEPQFKSVQIGLRLGL